ncbi:uncharacterized protein AMSG_11392 [Thecamonas trahens ATCC 50062]|uniref:Uncharacterized protein n=1 Tax=Thecamonas trahens ATCC 50062 TaxID=461836 RepID=A0A0L0DUB6_THETB|nr:hypothetical protein AMSG_11392 [Thecamonas trahens ATCC 50062]KNC55924.1 hypothetical protein AMSG_11392 [Thecamonas trahens ATCC 50062]|eukprot:XP_013752742.1 hypothetical protein AMSG_11392 [Thecamonas trahens ATCC 50062]
MPGKIDIETAESDGWLPSAVPGSTDSGFDVHPALKQLYTVPGSNHKGFEVACSSCGIIWATGDNIERLSNGYIYLYKLAFSTPASIYPDNDKQASFRFTFQDTKSTRAYLSGRSNAIVLRSGWTCACAGQPTPKDAVLGRGRVFVNLLPVDNTRCNRPVTVCIQTVMGHDRWCPEDSHPAPSYLWRCADLSALEYLSDDAYDLAGGRSADPFAGTAFNRLAVELAIDDAILSPDVRDNPNTFDLLARAFGSSSLRLPLMPVFLDRLLDRAEADDNRHNDLLRLQKSVIRGSCAKKLKKIERSRRTFAGAIGLRIDADHLQSPAFEFALLLAPDKSAMVRWNNYQLNMSQWEKDNQEAWKCLDSIHAAWQSDPDLDAVRSLTADELVAIGWAAIAERWLDNPPDDFPPAPDSSAAMWDLPVNMTWRSKYHPELMGQDLVSVDLKAANFVAVSAIADAITGNGAFVGSAASWADFVGAHMGSSRASGHLSKRHRLVALGSLLPDAVRLVQFAMTRAIATLLSSNLGDRCSELIITSCDEVVLVPVDSDDAQALADEAADLLASSRFAPALVSAHVYHLALWNYSDDMVRAHGNHSSESEDDDSTSSGQESHVIVSDNADAIKGWLVECPLGVAEEQARDVRAENTFCVLKNVTANRLTFKHLPAYLRTLAVFAFSLELSSYLDVDRDASRNAYLSRNRAAVIPSVTTVKMENIVFSS